MRITGGAYVRRTIKVPKGEIRPAMDRMRVSVFAALGDLEGLSFLDLFSGSGVVGIEAASRGAAPVTLVERDRGKREVILENLRIVESTIRLRIMPAERFVETSRGVFDVVFLDPPFAYGSKEALVRRIAERGIVGGTLLIHLPASESLPELIGDLARYDFRRYGRSTVAFYRREPAAPKAPAR